MSYFIFDIKLYLLLNILQGLTNSCKMQFFRSSFLHHITNRDSMYRHAAQILCGNIENALSVQTCRLKKVGLCNSPQLCFYEGLPKKLYRVDLRSFCRGVFGPYMEHVFGSSTVNLATLVVHGSEFLPFSIFESQVNSQVVKLWVGPPDIISNAIQYELSKFSDERTLLACSLVIPVSKMRWRELLVKKYEEKT